MSAPLFPRRSDRLRRAPNGRHPLLEKVLRAAVTAELGRTHGARRALAAVAAHSPEGEAYGRVARLFAGCLSARLEQDGTGQGNLYDGHTNPQDMLAAFGVLARATPFIRFGYLVANRCIREALRGSTRLHLIDVGIGLGTQWLSFLTALGRRPDRARIRVRLTGIDLPAAGPDPLRKLRTVGETLARHAERAGIAFAFQGAAGRAEEIDFAALRTAPGEDLAINAAFAMHHVPDEADAQAGQSRDAVLRRLRRLNPRVLALVEPDVDHNAPELVPRLRESMAHYLTVFDAMDTHLAAHPKERRILETAFFGAEIRNVITGEGAARVERHERNTSWHRRLLRAGFTPVDLTSQVRSAARVLGLRRPFGTGAQLKAVRLGWKGMPVIAASAWTPAR